MQEIRKSLSYLILFLLIGGCNQARLDGTTFLKSLACAQQSSVAPAALTAKPSPTVTLGASQLAAACRAPANYSCSARVFSPFIQDGRIVTPMCLNDANLGSVCMTVRIRNFDTASLRKSALATPVGFKAGGEFNHSEYSCYNMALSLSPAASAGEGSSLESALAASLAKCLSIVPSASAATTSSSGANSSSSGGAT